MDFFLWLEQTSFAVWIRESPSILAFPTILFMHTMGMGLLVGLNAAIDLRLLGFVPRVPLAPMLKLFPLMWIGFWVNAISGVLLVIADASRKFANPVFYVKLIFVALAVINMLVIRRQIFRDPALDKAPVALNGKRLAIISLILWAAAITAGRLMAYLGPRHV
jgi:hypothetical protein